MTSKLVGRHLSTLDQSGVIAAGDTRVTINGIVRNYSVIVISIISDVDIEVDILWSVDGQNFAYDPADSIFHTGDPDASFYERTVKGTFLKYVIENPGLVDTTVFTKKTYAKAAANIDFSELIPVQEPVWWVRDPADPSQTTSLLPPFPGGSGSPDAGNLCYCNLNIQNNPDPSENWRSQTVFLGEFANLNYNNKIRAGNASDRNRSFYRMFAACNNNIDIIGPGIIGCSLLGCTNLEIENTDSSPQDNNFTETAFICVSNRNQRITNLNNSLVTTTYDTVINNAGITRPSGLSGGGVGNNLFQGCYGSTFSDASPTINGADMRRNSVVRCYNGTFEKDSITGCFIAGSYIDSSTSSTLQGVTVITDDDVNAAPTPVPVDAPTGGGTGDANAFHARFANGYWFYTNADHSSGYRVDGNTASPICDERFKTNLSEYTDTAGVLSRLVACKVQTYNIKSNYETDPVKEGANFRITPTSQDFNAVFHPEEGDSATINSNRINECRGKYCDRRREKETKKLEKQGLKDPADPLTQEQSDAIDAMIEGELLDPVVQTSIEKESIMTLSSQEYLASLHLAIKELSKQVDLLKDRCDALENPPV